MHGELEVDWDRANPKINWLAFHPRTRAIAVSLPIRDAGTRTTRLIVLRHARSPDEAVSFSGAAGFGVYELKQCTLDDDCAEATLFYQGLVVVASGRRIIIVDPFNPSPFDAHQDGYADLLDDSERFVGLCRMHARLLALVRRSDGSLYVAEVDPSREPGTDVVRGVAAAWRIHRAWDLPEVERKDPESHARLYSFGSTWVAANGSHIWWGRIDESDSNCNVVTTSTLSKSSGREIQLFTYHENWILTGRNGTADTLQMWARCDDGMVPAFCRPWRETALFSPLPRAGSFHDANGVVYLANASNGGAELVELRPPGRLGTSRFQAAQSDEVSAVCSLGDGMLVLSASGENTQADLFSRGRKLTYEKSIAPGRVLAAPIVTPSWVMLLCGNSNEAWLVVVDIERGISS